MTSRRRALILCIFLCAVPSSARAGIIDLIDQWSGPGPFIGYGIEWRVVCLSEPDPDPARKAQAEEKLRDDGAEGPKTKLAKALGIVGPECFFKPIEITKRRVASFDVGFRFYKSQHNRLWDGVPVDEDFKRVYLTRLDTSLWWRFARSAELGLGGGVFWISGQAFEPFTRVYLKPVQVDFKPIAAFHGDSTTPWGSMDEWLAIRAGFITIPSGFKAADFGAPSGYKAVREFNWTLEAFIDLEPLVRRLKTQPSAASSRPRR